MELRFEVLFLFIAILLFEDESTWLAQVVIYCAFPFKEF